MTSIEISTTPQDEADFIQMVDKIISATVAKIKPEHITIVQIDNWFDHKWLRFSGKVLGALGQWKKELTLPPFIPDRVINQTDYQLKNGMYERVEAEAIHFYQYSDQNFKRKVSQITVSGMFVWYTSNTVKNGKGSLMVYSQIGNESTPWFVSFEKKTDWEIHKAKGIPVEVVKDYMA